MSNKSFTARHIGAVAVTLRGAAEL